MKIKIIKEKLYINGIAHDVCYFHKPEEQNGFLGNWYMSDFVVDNTAFNCMEQYIMYRKCLMFGDLLSAEEVMQTSNPAVQKDIARKATGYNDIVWAGIRQAVLLHGLIAKFSQNKELKEALLATDGCYLVECANTDKIWACGAGLNREERKNIYKWTGGNILGFALMEVREMLKVQCGKNIEANM